MKKILSIVLLFLLLIGCGDNTNGEVNGFWRSSSMGVYFDIEAPKVRSLGLGLGDRRNSGTIEKVDEGKYRIVIKM